MATLPNINTPVVNPGAAPNNNVITGAGDDFVAEYGAVYLLRFNNGSATPGSVILDDVTTPAPVGNTAFNPDVTVPVPAGQARSIRVDANRFLNTATGKIAWTYSASMVNAASVVEIYRIG